MDIASTGDKPGTYKSKVIAKDQNILIEQSTHKAFIKTAINRCFSIRYIKH